MSSFAHLTLAITATTLLLAGCASSQPQPQSRLDRIAAKANSATGGVLILNDASWQSEVIQASNSQPVMVDLWATWCGPCKMQAPIVDELAHAMPEAKFGKLDVDANRSDDSLGIQAIPTLLIFRNGKEVKRFVGVTQKAELEAALREQI